jgi:hypothetical protein
VTFSPQKLPAGSGATNIKLSIQVPAQSAMLERNKRLGGELAGVALGLLLLPFGGGIRCSGKRMKPLACIVFLLATASLFAGLTGCGESYIRSPQTYTVTATATSGPLSQSTTVTLILEP